MAGSSPRTGLRATWRGQAVLMRAATRARRRASWTLSAAWHATHSAEPEWKVLAVPRGPSLSPHARCSRRAPPPPHPAGAPAAAMACSRPRSLLKSAGVCAFLLGICLLAAAPGVAQAGNEGEAAAAAGDTGEGADTEGGDSLSTSKCVCVCVVCNGVCAEMYSKMRIAVRMSVRMSVCLFVSVFVCESAILVCEVRCACVVCGTSMCVCVRLCASVRACARMCGRTHTCLRCLRCLRVCL